ncbi:DUF1830 domain-containing protein [Synechococcus sp. UW179A]|uniref:DUF1830 domain-containing protein n=1 Tax=Synechococcus sp. UW179A TaxID=2575510 RepID=UPI000E0E3A12|nr:DUF1830 domain-containing protein [Synechococcus sp. UW179A]
MIECVYQNETNKMVIVKCIGQNNFYLEKVVMPKEFFWFEAPKEARLELWKMSPQGQMLDIRGYVADHSIKRDITTETAYAS